MSKALTGPALFVFLITTGCSGVHGGHAAESPLPQPVRSSEPNAANGLKPGFVGEQRIGGWTLICRKVEEKQGSSSMADQPVTSSVVNKAGHQMLDIKIAVPTRPCLLTTVLQPADRMERQTAVNFELRGPYGVLFLIFRAPKELFPGPEAPHTPTSSQASVNSADNAVTLRFGGRTLKGWRIGCGPFACINGTKIRQEDEPAFLAAKDIAIELPALAGKEPLRIHIPATGLAEAIGALRRVEK